MKKIFTTSYFQLTLLCILSVGFSAAQNPGLQWAKNIGGSRGDDIIVDAAGNVYTTGYFAGVADFDPGPGTFYMTADGAGADDAYVSKLDINGNFLWAIRLGGSSVNHGRALGVDAAGNVYSTGEFSGTVDLDPGPAVFNLTSNGQYDIYISKVDAAGNFVWAKNIGGATSDIPFSLVMDAAGNIVITGVFIGIVDFDPGPAVFNLNGGGNNDCFIVKIDAGGNFVWAKQVAGNYSQGDAISTDAAGNLYICGNYNFTADLDPGAGVYNVTATSGVDVFIIKLDAAGNFVWGRSVGGLGTDVAESVKADAAGNVYVTGNFPFTVDFDPGPATFNVTVAGVTDVYLLKLDVNGNFAWVKTFAGLDAEAGHDVVIDATGNIFVTGLFIGTVDFDPGLAVYDLTSFGPSTDIFIVKLDAAGNFVYAVRFGGTTLDGGLALDVDQADVLHATGYFQEVCDFDPGPGTVTLNSADGATFIIKLGAPSVVPITLLNFSGTALPGGILLQWKTAQEINTSSFNIEWSADGSVFQKIGEQPAAGNSSGTIAYSFLHGTPARGDNFYLLKMVDVDGRFTYSPVVKVNMPINRFSINVSPNPVTDILTLQIIAVKDEEIELILHSSEGRKIASKRITVTKGSNRISWDLQTIPLGTYFISNTNGLFKTIRINKQR